MTSQGVAPQLNELNTIRAAVIKRLFNIEGEKAWVSGIVAKITHIKDLEGKWEKRARDLIQCNVEAAWAENLQATMTGDTAAATFPQSWEKIIETFKCEVQQQLTTDQSLTDHERELLLKGAYNTFESHFLSGLETFQIAFAQAQMEAR